MHPTYTVHWSAEDGEYVATVEGQSLLSWLDPDPTAALAGLVAVIESTPA